MRLRALVLFAGVLAATVHAFGASTAVCEMPTNCLAGVPFQAQITVSPDEAVGVYAVEEQVPEGWGVSAISHSGRFDAGNRKVKWGPFLDRTARVLSYEVTPAAAAQGAFTFLGQVAFNDFSVPISGIRQVTVLTGLEANQVVCEMQARYLPGVALILTNRVTPAANVTVYAVEDQIPQGWTPSGLSHGGSYDAAQRKLKWGPFFDNAPRVLTAQLTPPADAAGLVVFGGAGAFDGFAVPIAGQRQIWRMASVVVCAAPPRFQPLVAFHVALAVTPEATVQAQAIQDTIPAGWTVGAISHGGVFDAVNHAVKWGPFFDALERTLGYDLTAPAGAIGAITLAGRGSFDGIDVAISGQRQLAGLGASVVCSMPLEFLPGAAFTVTNVAIPEPTVSVYAVEDQVPAGWTVLSVNAGGAFDAAQRKVKWGPFFDAAPREFTYQVLPPSGALSPATFAGLGSFDGVGVVITGQRSIALVPLAAANGVVRGLPEFIRAGRTTTVTNQVRVAANISVYAVEDSVPAGWGVGAISDAGRYDAVNRRVKWGPFFDIVPRKLTYELTAPPGAAGRIEFDGQGSFDGVSLGVEGPSSLEALPNYAPVARDDTVERPRGSGLSVPAAQLLANDSDANDDALSVVSVAAVSAQGGTVRLSGGVVSYTPPAGPEADDRFSYTISDGSGGVATAVVWITVVAPPTRQALTGIEVRAGGVVRLQLTGTPGQTYQVQATVTLGAPVWVTLGTRVASSTGDFSFDDLEAPSHRTRFYRSATP